MYLIKDFFFVVPSLHFSLFQDDKSKSSQEGDAYKWAGIEAVMQSYLMHAAGELCKSCNVESIFPVHPILINARPANLSSLSMTHCTYDLLIFEGHNLICNLILNKILLRWILSVWVNSWGFVIVIEVSTEMGIREWGLGGTLLWRNLRNASHLRCIFSSYFQFKVLPTIVEHNFQAQLNSQARHSKSRCQNE